MRLIDADALKSVFSEWLSENSDYRTIPQIIDGAPTIDAEPVVRCKDCKHRGYDACPMCFDYDEYDEDFGYEFRVIDRTVDDGFCHKGAKMDGGTEC